MIKNVEVILDEYTDRVARAFDYEFKGVSTFVGFDKPDVPKQFNIGVIFGASGSGKSTLLQEFGVEPEIVWNPEKAIICHFETPDIGIDRLSAAGLNSIPSWCKPYHVLSTGEKFRADIARRLQDGAIIDEFTSVVDRNVARAASVSIAKYIRSHNIQNVVLATCHHDILEWLEPDWTFNTDNGELLVGRSLRQPEIKIDIFRCDRGLWRMFAKHHYLNGTMNKSAQCFAGVYSGDIIAFSAIMPFPSGQVRNGWREHRTVVLPDYQGMGIGTRFSEAVASIFLENGKRFFSKTAHIRMGQHRNNSPLWRPTSKNMKLPKNTNTKEFVGRFYGWKVSTRFTYCHEYIGEQHGEQ